MRELAKFARWFLLGFGMAFPLGVRPSYILPKRRALVFVTGHKQRPGQDLEARGTRLSDPVKAGVGRAPVSPRVHAAVRCTPRVYMRCGPLAEGKRNRRIGVRPVSKFEPILRGR